MRFSILSLAEYCSNRKITCTTHYFKRQLPIRCSYYWCSGQMGFQLFKALLAFLFPNKFSIFFYEFIEGFSNLRDVFDESSIESCMTKEFPNCFYIRWGGQFGNKFNFCFVNFYSPAGNNVPQYNSLVKHKMALLSVEHQVILYAPLQNSLQIR